VLDEVASHVLGSFVVFGVSMSLTHLRHTTLISPVGKRTTANGFQFSGRVII
jgi:hypothetical protein